MSLRAAERNAPTQTLEINAGDAYAEKRVEVARKPEAADTAVGRMVMEKRHDEGARRAVGPGQRPAGGAPWEHGLP